MTLGYSLTTKTPTHLESLFLQRAVQVGEELLHRAFQCGDGSLSWGRGLALDDTPTSDAGIFSGRAGEAVVLAMLASAARDSRYAAASLDAMRAVIRGVEDADYAPQLVKTVGVGLTGVGSLVYALCRISQLLQRDDLLTCAARLSTSLPPNVIHAQGMSDVIKGSAGCLLGLLSVRAAGVSKTQNAIDSVIERLLESRVVDSASGRRAWLAASQQIEVGFAHGSTGIAHALLSAYRYTGNRACYAAATEAFEFERTVYDSEVMDWPDYIGQPRGGVGVAWCHGAVGVGLSRISALDVLEGKDAERAWTDLEQAVTSVLLTGVRSPDNLCCGSLGRIDFLLETGTRLGDDRLLDAAYTLGTQLADHMSKHGYRSSPAEEAKANGPGLWQGLAGIAYLFLRLANPMHHPCLLSLESTPLALRQTS